MLFGSERINFFHSHHEVLALVLFLALFVDFDAHGSKLDLSCKIFDKFSNGKLRVKLDILLACSNRSCLFKIEISSKPRAVVYVVVKD